MRKILSLFLGQKLTSALIEKIHQLIYSGERSFSQEGEDRLLANIFRGKDSGFYVDVGAHHPYYLSNTHLFYKRGWRGLNIDANPECISNFRRIRKQDINVNSGVGSITGKLAFHNFEEPALSTFDEKLSLDRQKEGRKLKEKILIQVEPLENLLDRYLPENVQIDFLNVDVEGLDLEVLKSNDWARFRPSVILVECLDLDLENLSDNETYRYLRSCGYRFFGRLVNTCVFIENKGAINSAHPGRFIYDKAS